jgi:hypothetical protein
VKVLKRIIKVTYFEDGSKDKNSVAGVQQKFDDLKLQFPQLVEFLIYFKKQWVSKMHMWMTSFQNVLHAGQDTNATVESYYTSTKTTMNGARQKFQGRQMDLLIYQLTKDVITHYWYALHCKLYGFWANRNIERIVVTVVL